MTLHYDSYCEKEFPELYKEILDAKSYINSDTRSSLFKIRFVLEKLSDSILHCFGLFPKENLGLYEKTNLIRSHIQSNNPTRISLKDEKQLVDKMDYIRTRGNDAVHEEVPTIKEVEICLNYLRDIEVWLSVYLMTEYEVKELYYTIAQSDIKPTFNKGIQKKVLKRSADNGNEVWISSLDLGLNDDNKNEVFGRVIDKEPMDIPKFFRERRKRQKPKKSSVLLSILKDKT